MILDIDPSNLQGPSTSEVAIAAIWGPSSFAARCGYCSKPGRRRRHSGEHGVTAHGNSWRRQGKQPHAGPPPSSVPRPVLPYFVTYSNYQDSNGASQPIYRSFPWTPLHPHSIPQLQLHPLRDTRTEKESTLSSRQQTCTFHFIPSFHPILTDTRK